jgi:hypothetical protein
MTANYALKDFLTMYLKNSNLLKEEQFEAEMISRIKGLVGRTPADRDLLEFVGGLEDSRRSPEVNVKRLTVLLSILSFSIVP